MTFKAETLREEHSEKLEKKGEKKFQKCKNDSFFISQNITWKSG